MGFGCLLIVNGNLTLFPKFVICTIYCFGCWTLSTATLIPMDCGSIRCLPARVGLISLSPGASRPSVPAPRLIESVPLVRVPGRHHSLIRSASLARVPGRHHSLIGSTSLARVPGRHCSLIGSASLARVPGRHQSLIRAPSPLDNLNALALFGLSFIVRQQFAHRGLTKDPNFLGSLSCQVETSSWTFRMTFCPPGPNGSTRPQGGRRSSEWSKRESQPGQGETPRSLGPL